MNRKFIQDDDGHWYLVPEDKLERFWETFEMPDDYATFIAEFQRMRCDHPSQYTVQLV